MNPTDKQCPECDGAMNEIKIVNRIMEGMHINLNNQLDYMAPDAKRSRFEHAHRLHQAAPHARE